MSKNIELASGAITTADTITIELLEPARGKPAVVAIHWPTHPTVCTPALLDAVIAASTRVLTNAVLELARLKKGKGAMRMSNDNPMSDDSVAFLDAINMIDASSRQDHETFEKILKLYEGRYEHLAWTLGQFAGDILSATRRDHPEGEL